MWELDIHQTLEHHQGGQSSASTEVSLFFSTYVLSAPEGESSGTYVLSVPEGEAMEEDPQAYTCHSLWHGKHIRFEDSQSPPTCHSRWNGTHLRFRDEPIEEAEHPMEADPRVDPPHAPYWNGIHNQVYEGF